MNVASVRAAFPRHYYPQEAILEALRRRLGAGADNGLKRLDSLHRNVQVSGRHLALPIEEYDSLTTWGRANDAWIRVATDLGAEALAGALADAGVAAGDLDALFFTTVTGIATPSVDAKLVNRLGLPPRIKRVPMFGLGCVAGAAGLARAADYVRAWPGHSAALVAVELCSLTLQRGDRTVANMIASGLFGDGAAAAVVTGADRAATGPRVMATRSVFYPDSEDVMGWRISEQGFGIVLSADVPRVVQEHLRRDVDTFLAEQGLQRGDMAAWICHPGGPRVLEAMAAALELPEADLQAAWDSLARIGNLSSASVLVVLGEYLGARRPAPGSLGMLMAMGPGFCSELVLLRF